MNVTSLKDYARQHNVSYEAIRKQVARFRLELEGHIILDGRQQFLDEEAVAFLDARREKNPISIIQQDKDDTIKALENENKSLLQQIVVLQEALLNEKNQRLEIADKIAKIELLEESKETAELALENAKEREADLRAENEALRSQKLDAEIKLEETKKDLQDANFDLETAENIAKENEQEAARAKTEVEDLRRELEELKAFNALPWWKKIRMKKPPV